MPERIKYFVSYAHRNKKIVADFLDRLSDVLAPSKAYQLIRWIDHDLVLGEDWEEQIFEAMEGKGTSERHGCQAYTVDRYVSMIYVD